MPPGTLNKLLQFITTKLTNKEKGKIPLKIFIRIK